MNDPRTCFFSQVNLGLWNYFENILLMYVCVCLFEVILHSNKIVYNPFLVTRVYDEIS